MEKKDGIGSRLRALRKKKGLTPKEVADKLDVTPTTITHYELENRKPPIHVIRDLAILYETTSDFIIGHETPKKDFKFFLNQENLNVNGVPLRKEDVDLIKQLCELIHKRATNQV